MIRRYLLPAFVLALLIMAIFGEEVWQFMSVDPIGSLQDGAQDIIQAFNDFISGH
ncbi:hypothetical protein [Vibrio ezurae]|uniref:Uncharacterized protein n=1 Tax=Vibrio ezurae NBRC 102218 TaxID=1219080 RepID=U3AJ38_9VIBR|nr:hypothetical protein [Vibrio ezurae]GAD79926.1 hypothetical protein VEZ01S_21_00480 [Vibrio ezurae NBRC 102218]